MLKRLNHIAIVVPDIKEAGNIYREKFNAVVSKPKSYPEHGVTVVFVELENTKIELMEPYGDNSPIKRFLDKNPYGGMHHICVEVSDIDKSLGELNIKPIFVVDSKKLNNLMWFKEEILATKGNDFFVKRSINYSKKAKSITEDDLF